MKIKSKTMFFRSSILEERKYSFKNLKLTKATTVKVGNEAVKLKVSLTQITRKSSQKKYFII